MAFIVYNIIEEDIEVRRLAEEHGLLVWMAGILLIFSADAESQDPAFSQFYANPLYMNPAMAGVEGPPKVYLGYRNQWPGAVGSRFSTPDATTHGTSTRARASGVGR